MPPDVSFPAEKAEKKDALSGHPRKQNKHPRFAKPGVRFAAISAAIGYGCKCSNKSPNIIAKTKKKERKMQYNLSFCPYVHSALLLTADGVFVHICYLPSSVHRAEP